MPRDPNHAHSHSFRLQPVGDLRPRLAQLLWAFLRSHVALVPVLLLWTLTTSLAGPTPISFGAVVSPRATRVAGKIRSPRSWAETGGGGIRTSGAPGKSRTTGRCRSASAVAPATTADLALSPNRNQHVQKLAWRRWHRPCPNGRRIFDSSACARERGVTDASRETSHSLLDDRWDRQSPRSHASEFTSHPLQ